MRTLPVVLVSLAALLPAQPPDHRLSPRAKAMMEKMGHGEGNLRVGDMAPGFTLRKVKSDETVGLSSLRNKPVALVFGSYT